MPSKTGSVLAIGEVLWDMLPSGPRLGDTTANFSIGCSRLGHSAALVSCVGVDPLGQEALELLAIETEGLQFDLSLIQSTAAAPTGTVDVLLGPHGHPQYTIAAPVAWDEIRMTPEAQAAAENASAVCFGTLAQRDPVSRNTIRELLSSVSKDCLRVHDVNVRLPFCSDEVVQWSLQHADAVKISDEELAFVSGVLDSKFDTASAQTLPELEKAARLVLDYAQECKLVAITRGAHGSLLVTRNKSDAHPGFPTKVQDSVGAGDAFTAGLVHALLHGAELPAINQAANLCGSYVAGCQGATPPFSAGLMKKLQDVLAA